MTEGVRDDDELDGCVSRRLHLLSDRTRDPADDELIANLLIALESSRTIGQAQGILMERDGISRDDAFARLMVLSQHQNVKLRLIATDMVKRYESSGGPAGRLVEPAGPGGQPHRPP